MMRVLFLCHRYTDVSLGGLAEFLHFLPIALKQHSIHSIIYTSPQVKTRKLVGPHLLPNQVRHYSGPLLKPRIFIDKSELFPLLELCKEEKIDLIHAQGTYRAGYMAMHVYRQLDIPYVVTSHSDILVSNSKRMRSFTVRKRCQKILKKASFVTHLSPLMAEGSEQIYQASHKSKIIHNGIDVDAWQDYLHTAENENSSSGLLHPTKNVGFAKTAAGTSDYLLAIGRLEPEKGFPVLIDAYAKLVKQNIQTSLVIAGTGSIEQSLQAQAKQHGLNTLISKHEGVIPKQSVIFTGHVQNNVKKILFAHAKLILFATQGKQWLEPFGIVQLEAMAAGKPLIASDIPIVRYLQSFGLQSKLVEAENIEAWTHAILQLMEDKDLLESMGKINREVAKKFSWEKIAKEYADVYRNINIRACSKSR